MLLSFISGPALPKTLGATSSLTQGNDLIVVGGRSETGGSHYSASIYKLTCNNGEFTWKELEVKLQTARRYFVADFITNVEADFIPNDP